MQTSNTRSIAGLILAGGRGERLSGVMKSGVEVGGVRLLDRVAEALASCTPLLVAYGHTEPDDMGLPATMQPVPDPVGDIAGPLAGLVGAMTFLRQQPDRPEFIVTAAVDTPFLPPDYVERLWLAVGKSAAAVASHAGQRYPTNAIWRIAPLLALTEPIAAGTGPRSLKSLALAVDAVEVPWAGANAHNPFANINTPADLDAAQAYARSIGEPSA
jgi:molybdopterin-guanine dinucleotide biosynthesis protein A